MEWRSRWVEASRYLAWSREQTNATRSSVPKPKTSSEIHFIYKAVDPFIGYLEYL
jgi:hypothetical protein